MTKEAIEALLKTLDVWLIVFGVFVAIGVVGESIAGFLHFRRGGELQRIQSSENLAQQREIERLKGLTESSEERITEAQKEAAQANALAKRYEGEIAEADARAKAAEAQVASADAASKEAVAKVAIAEEHTAEARSMAASEQLERAKLEALVAPRRIGLEDQRRIKAALKNFAGRTVRVSSYGLDGEGVALGTQIIATLKPEINVVDERAQSIVSGGFDFGVHVRGPKADLAFVYAIADSLRSIAKLQVFVNMAIARTSGLHGNAVLSGNAVISGGGGDPGAPGTLPPGSAVWIEVGIKPVEPVNGLR